MSTRPVWTMKGDLVKKPTKPNNFLWKKYSTQRNLKFFDRRKLGSKYGDFPHYICVFNIWKYVKCLFLLVFFICFYTCVWYRLWVSIPCAHAGCRGCPFCSCLCPTGRPSWKYLCSTGRPFSVPQEGPSLFHRGFLGSNQVTGLVQQTPLSAQVSCQPCILKSLK